MSFEVKQVNSSETQHVKKVSITLPHWASSKNFEAVRHLMDWCKIKREFRICGLGVNWWWNIKWSKSTVSKSFFL